MKAHGTTRGSRSRHLIIEFTAFRYLPPFIDISTTDYPGSRTKIIVIVISCDPEPPFHPSSISSLPFSSPYNTSPRPRYSFVRNKLFSGRNGAWQTHNNKNRDLETKKETKWRSNRKVSAERLISTFFFVHRSSNIAPEAKESEFANE